MTLCRQASSSPVTLSTSTELVIRSALPYYYSSSFLLAGLDKSLYDSISQSFPAAVSFALSSLPSSLRSHVISAAFISTLYIPIQQISMSPPSPDGRGGIKQGGLSDTTHTHTHTNLPVPIVISSFICCLFLLFLDKQICKSISARKSNRFIFPNVFVFLSWKRAVEEEEERQERHVLYI